VQHKKRFGLGFVALLILLAPVIAQGCSLCYTQASSGTTGFVSALREAILVLMLPPIFMSAAMAWLAYRKRNHFRQDTNEGEAANFE
jgi:hypothetical protein